MGPIDQQFREEYARALAEFVSSKSETALGRAVQLGQQASARGLSAETIVRVHQDALLEFLSCVGCGTGAKSCALLNQALPEEQSGAIASFFHETLAAYETANAQLTTANSALRHINEALEQQASRIAHALHDEAGQILTVVHLKLAKAEQRLAPDAGPYLSEIRTLLDQIEQQLRRFSHELRPVALDDFGLVAALEFLIQGVMDRAGLKVELEAASGAELPRLTEIVVYRFVQEALTNITRHARARHVMVRLRRTAGELTCSVSDDGAGFDPASYRPGMGLSGMRQRVQALGGQFSLHSSPGGGTEISAKIPVQQVN
jgi:signal transduction histidine kinase